MKQFPNESIQTLAPSGKDLAALLMDVVPLIMRYIRTEMRSRRMRGLSVPQFRSLIFLRRNEGSSLSEVANHIGLTLPSASKVIEVLVTRKLVARTELRNDRRYSSLKLTKLGQTTLLQAQRGTEAGLAERLDALSPARQKMAVETMRALSYIFKPTEKSPESKSG
jgi:DNA-binding MarR family transcriptional regulator